jgi:hypothetical protein
MQKSNKNVIDTEHNIGDLEYLIKYKNYKN